MATNPSILNSNTTVYPAFTQATAKADLLTALDELQRGRNFDRSRLQEIIFKLSNTTAMDDLATATINNIYS